jgi:hypothetical protein
MNLPNFDAMYKEMAAGLPNSVTCLQCGRQQTVNPEYCLRRGWPKCHGQTMALDSQAKPGAESK